MATDDEEIAVSTVTNKPEDNGENTKTISPTKDEKAKTPEPDPPPRAKSPGSPATECSICLAKLENKSFTDSCLHTFCFVCLVEWSKVKPVCPLCKQPFKSIFHNIRAIDDFDQYDIPQPDPTSASSWENPGGVRFRYRTTMLPGRDRRTASFHIAHQSVAARNNEEHAYSSSSSHVGSVINARLRWRRRRQEATSDFRRMIYARETRVKPPEHSRYGFRDVSPEFYRQNPACTHRLVPWLNRELNVLLNNHRDNVQFVLELIIDLVKRFSIRSPEFREHILTLIGSRVDHFIHEFYNFARSPYDMMAYDQRAVYNEVEDRTGSSPDSDGDVVFVTEEQGSRATAGTRNLEAPLSRSFFFQQHWDVTPLLSQVRSFLVGTDTAHSGWDSPTPGTSVFSSPPRPTSPNDTRSHQCTPPLVDVNTDSSSSPEQIPKQETPADGGDVVVDSDGSSDCVVVKIEKPWADRTPILLSSGSDSEHNITVVRDSNYRSSRRKRKHREKRSADNESASAEQASKRKRSRHDRRKSHSGRRSKRRSRSEHRSSKRKSRSRRRRSRQERSSSRSACSRNSSVEVIREKSRKSKKSKSRRKHRKHRRKSATYSISDSDVQVINTARDTGERNLSNNKRYKKHPSGHKSSSGTLKKQTNIADDKANSDSALNLMNSSPTPGTSSSASTSYASSVTSYETSAAAIESGSGGVSCRKNDSNSDYTSPACSSSSYTSTTTTRNDDISPEFELRESENSASKLDDDADSSSPRRDKFDACLNDIQSEGIKTVMNSTEEVVPSMALTHSRDDDSNSDPVSTCEEPELPTSSPLSGQTVSQSPSLQDLETVRDQSMISYRFTDKSIEPDFCDAGADRSVLISSFLNMTEKITGDKNEEVFSEPVLSECQSGKCDIEILPSDLDNTEVDKIVEMKEAPSDNRLEVNCE
ncbi:uncharacterized protein LOC141900226 [Tubulanus polymorphus]|uniref:uncharacterized protein LOC141900226 n=1 Tax=Tubulanus polymorphus TaxID=672921 RepID=UPI003DA205DB